MTNLENIIKQISIDAKNAFFNINQANNNERNLLLTEIASEINNNRELIKSQNKLDEKQALEKNINKSLLNRLIITDTIIDDMINNINNISNMSDILGKTISNKILSNGINLTKVKVPIGVIAVIFESRPNIITDVAALCIKSGNAVILRGGSEAKNTNFAIASIIESVLNRHKNFINAVQIIKIIDKEAVNILSKQEEYIDLLILRGGESLINAVKSIATIPVLKNYKGLCHIYVDKSADIDMAINICINAKCQRPGVCNAVETILVHQDIANKFLPLLYEKLTKNNVQVRGDSLVKEILPQVHEAKQEDWSCEYLDLIVSIGVMKDINCAIKHINHFGSHHSDSIITQDKNAQNLFCQLIDSAVVYVNASTRFSDGAIFGLGAEIGISTDKLHARGPMGLNELTTYKWLAIGNGQVRT